MKDENDIIELGVGNDEQAINMNPNRAFARKREGEGDSTWEAKSLHRLASSVCNLPRYDISFNGHDFSPNPLGVCTIVTVKD